MNRWIIAGMLAVALLLSASVASASHSWGSYHWARTSNPFTLQLVDSMPSAWDPYLGAVSTDWSNSSVLDTAIVQGSTNGRQCKPLKGTVQACNEKYGFNGWLGLATTWISGSHIVQGTAKVNDSYFDTSTYNNSNAKRHVLCQEVGHTFTFYPTPPSLPITPPSPVLAPPTTPIYQPPTKVLIVSGRFTCQIDSLGIEITNLGSTPILSDDLLFKLDNLSVPCGGLPESMNSSTNCTIIGIPSAREHVVEVFAEPGVSISVGFRCPLVIADPATLTPRPTIEEPPPNISSFVEWANQHSIHLVGINKSANEVYFQGLDEADKINLSDVPYWWGAEALRKIPEEILQVMKDKTIYFSAKRGRGYALATAFLRGTTAGFILEQRISGSQAVHEFGHILDFVGIKGEPGDPNNIFSHAKAERNRLFNVSAPYNPRASEPPIGFISVYSSANDQENFAEHFFFYVLYPQIFKERMQNDTLLKEKYEFFKKWIFEGKEY